APRPDPAAAARARAARPRAFARRRLDLDDPRLLSPPPARAPVCGRDRPALPRARRQPGARAPGRGVPFGARGVLRREHLGAAAPACLLRRAATAADADRRARDAPVVRPPSA